MIVLTKAVRESYWWSAGGNVMLDPKQIESIESMTDTNPGGSTSPAYRLIIMKSGAQHKVMESQDKITDLYLQDMDQS